jgi:hypothetical protein
MGDLSTSALEKELQGSALCDGAVGNALLEDTLSLFSESLNILSSSLGDLAMLRGGVVIKGGNE